MRTLRNIIYPILIGGLLVGSYSRGYSVYHELESAEALKRKNEEMSAATRRGTKSPNFTRIVRRKEVKKTKNISVYMKDNGRGNLDIYAHIFYPDINSGIEKRLTTDPGEDIYPLLSPDKTKIIYYHKIKGAWVNDQLKDLYALNVIGIDGKKIMTMKNTCFYPLAKFAKWSDDSKKIIYTIWVPQKFFVTCEADVETGKIREKKRFNSYERNVITGEIEER